MIRAAYFQKDQEQIPNIQPEEFANYIAKSNGFLWVDFQGATPQFSEPILSQVFGFHPLAIDDALRETHIPKVDAWDNYLYIVLASVAYDRNTADLEISELDIFLGCNYLVSHHDLPIQALERIWNTCKQDQRYGQMGADHLLYKLSDELTVDFMRTVEEIDDAIEWAEDEIFARPSNEIVQQIFSLKRATLHLRRSLSPLREVYNKLARDDYNTFIDKKDRIYFRDVYDHMVRLHEISENLRDLVSGVLDTYLSVINNRMNEVMKTLTSITTLFMPISFLASFFGMNFFLASRPISALSEAPAFGVVMALMILLPVTMYWWIRQRGWM